MTEKELRALSKLAYFDMAKFHDPNRDPNARLSVYDALTPEQRTTMNSFGIKDDTLRSWTVKGVHNDNDVGGSGFFAAIIETGDGQASAIFRGSEELNSVQDVQQDWVGADLGLLNTTMTDQQAEAREFLKSYKDVLEQYESVTMTGHSLGGNLAEYSTIVSAEYGLDDNITQCSSLDGPGFSREFLNKYRKEIANMSDVITHYRWSWVGGLLQDLPGATYVQIDVVPGEGFGYYFTKHSLEFVKTKGDSFVSGEQDTIAAILEHITQGIDEMPSVLGDLLVTTLGGVWIGYTWLSGQIYDENGNLNGTGWAVLGSAVALISAIGIPEALIGTLTIVTALVVVLAAAALIDLIHDGIMAVVEAVGNMIAAAYNWVKEKAQEFVEKLKNVVKDALTWFRNTFNPGCRNANQNPYIIVDTYKMETYAGRLEKVNRTLSSLDNRLARLYDNVDVWDLGDLQSGDMKIGWSTRLNKCAGYLRETAAEFAKADSAVANKI